MKNGPPNAGREPRGDKSFWDAIAEVAPDVRGPAEADGERLQKVLARSGIGSRRVCEDLIAARRVRVNGEVAVLGRRVDPDNDVIEVDHVRVAAAQGLVYYLLNKPRGVITTAFDPQGRQTVVDLVPDDPRVFPVGRLDFETEGLLLLTNDGELSQRMTHPSFGVEKEYLASVSGTLTPGELRQLRDGVDLEDGRTSPAHANEVSPGVVRIAIHEGRNRQIRRMLEAVGHPVQRLVRTRIGPITDDRLRPGEWRPLYPPEIRALSEAATPKISRRDRRAAEAHGVAPRPTAPPQSATARTRLSPPRKPSGNTAARPGQIGSAGGKPASLRRDDPTD